MVAVVVMVFVILEVNGGFSVHYKFDHFTLQLLLQINLQLTFG
ncbi:hypothetical protein PP707_05320 [Acetobacter pasteurianus]|nr:hypothetical protein [Acetobacter pasteurianus]